MPIVRRTDCIKPHVMLASICLLRLCGVGTRAECSAVQCHLLVLSSPRLMMHVHTNLKPETDVSFRTTVDGLERNFDIFLIHKQSFVFIWFIV